MTLAAAAVSKLRRPADARAGWRALAPRRVQAVPGAFWLPAVAETVLALGLLLPGWAGRVALVGACLLFLGFAAALARAVGRAEPGECGCFGSLSREPITRLSVVRTTSLAAVAALAARAGWPGPGLVRAVAASSGRDLATGLVGALLGLLALVLSVTLGHARARARQIASTAARPSRPGDPIPRVEVVSPDGDAVLVADLRQAAGLLLVFASTTCASCREVLAELPSWQQRLGAGARIRVVTSSPRADFEAAHPDLAGSAYFGSLAARDALGVVGTPAAVLLGVDGTVATPVAHGAVEIEALLAGTLAAVQQHSSPSR